MSGSRTAIPDLNEILRDNETATSPDTEFGTTPDSAVFPPNEFVSTRASRPMFPNLPTSLSSNRRPSVIRLGSATDVANEARQYDELLNTDSDDEVGSTTDQEANEVFSEEVFGQPLFEPHDRYLHHHHHLRQSGEDFEVGAGEEGPGRGEDTAVSFEIGPLRTTDGGDGGGRGMTDDDEASPPDTGGVLVGLSLRGAGSARASTDLPPTIRRPLYPMFQAVDRRERDGSGGGGGGEQEDAVRMRGNRSSYPPLLPDHRGHPTAIHLGRRHPLSPSSAAHWNANRSGNRSGSRLPPVPRSGAYSGATTPREAHFGLHVHSHQQRPAASSANTNTADNAAAELPFSVAAPEGWQIVPRSNGDQQNRYEDGTRAAPILLTQFSSNSSEAEDEPGDCSSPGPPEWRASCKDSRARFKHVLESELFADVCFLVGAGAASNRPNTSISRRPSRLPTLSRQATFSNDTSDRKQRMISSMIAQVSGCVSRGQASPPAGAIDATAADEPTAAEKAQRLTELLLAMNIEQSATAAEGMLQPSDVSVDPSPSSSASSAASSVPTSSPLTEQGDQPSVAVMCDMTDTSDIDSDNRQVETTSTCTQTPTNAHTYNSQARPRELGEGSEATAVATATANAASGPVSATSAAGPLLKVDETAVVDGPTPKNAARPDSPDSTSRADFRDGDQLQQQPQQQQEPKRFYAHRLLLALASPVFEAMFFGMFTENRVCTRYPASAGTAVAGGNTRALSSNSDILELPISDVTPKAFHQCLRFIYYDDLQLSDDIDELYDILYAAKKYLLPQLASASASQLIKHMTPENVLFQLNKCSAIDEEELTRICWRTIDLMTSEVLASEPFVDLYKETVVELISRDTLCCKEWEIFEAVHRWASAECDRRGLSPTSTVVAELMTDFLPLIRFTTMSLGDFVLHVAKSGVLSLESQRDISVFIATEMFSQEESSKKKSDTNGDGDGESNKPVSSTNQTPVNLAISAVPRSGPPLFRCLRSSHAMVPMSKEGYWQEPEAVAFEVSSNVFLAGIGVSEPVGRGSSLKLKIEVRRCSIRQSVRAETGTRYHTVGVSTPVHRHSHQSHSVSTQAFYFQRPGDDSRRRMLRSVGGGVGAGGGNGSSVGYRPSLPSSPDQSNLRGSSGRSGLKLLVNRGHALGSIETVVRGSGSRPVAQIRFPKPILLKAGKTYVLIAKPEEARHTRCYVHMNVTRTEVRVRTRPSKQNEKLPSVAASWFPLAVPKHVVFHFWYCDKSQTNCSTEGNHIPEILFCPPT